jgi:TetR/AcrR family transcriptional regulator, transcriptional repressor for nem operon
LRAGELPQDAEPKRRARRFQANVTALRVELQRGVPAADIAELAADMARETLQLAVLKP